MEIGIHVQVTTCTDISIAERAGGLSERLEMVSSSEQVSVGTLPGRHSVALQIDAQRTGLKQLLLVSHRQMHAPTQTNSCSNSSSGEWEGEHSTLSTG